MVDGASRSAWRCSTCTGCAAAPTAAPSPRGPVTLRAVSAAEAGEGEEGEEKELHKRGREWKPHLAQQGRQGMAEPLGAAPVRPRRGGTHAQALGRGAQRPRPGRATTVRIMAPVAGGRRSGAGRWRGPGGAALQQAQRQGQGAVPGLQRQHRQRVQLLHTRGPKTGGAVWWKESRVRAGEAARCRPAGAPARPVPPCQAGPPGRGSGQAAAHRRAQACSAPAPPGAAVRRRPRGPPLVAPPCAGCRGERAPRHRAQTAPTHAGGAQAVAPHAKPRRRRCCRPPRTPP